ncbi:tetraacyldisaccharide 4'-kinase [Candidatus Tokpelaia sp.]|uniref:tetraacyldisaccharide 4'-kinase n=1 Tax=Candidatus Tokpelaia sp. TaxID=2233777 RepID=UPI001283CDBE|nr:tetraacyldisaccharide 4'-kinase [Candidatus Tokpelaia sp.]KAA6405230.1 tetraacyldisaccharide 4'-kinase [Candidatus Tokpelaia sp.]
MANETPLFWWKKRGLTSLLLSPAARIYGHFAARIMERARPPQIEAPVLCIGNFTLGGAGKTPLAAAFAKAAGKRGLKPGIVSRGYGGAVSLQRDRVYRVDPARDRARDVGDEPLLLAEYAPVAVAVNRLKAAEQLLREGVNFIIMDDGFQSRRLYSDYALMAVDSARGLGNGKIFPAGPLRAPLPVQLAYSDMIVLLGNHADNDAAGQAVLRLAAKAGKPVCRAILRLRISRPYEGTGSAAALPALPAENAALHEQNQTAGFKAAAPDKQPVANPVMPITSLRAIYGRRFLAFAGIGNPQKFFAGLEAAGGLIAQKRSFADHHFFSLYDIDDIVQSARAYGLIMATTAKDYMRLKTDGLDKKLGPLLVLDIYPEFLPEDFCNHILNLCVTHYKDRRFF